MKSYIYYIYTLYRNSNNNNNSTITTIRKAFRMEERRMKELERSRDRERDCKDMNVFMISEPGTLD